MIQGRLKAFFVWYSYVQDTIARYPSKFAGVARVDPTDPASVEKLELLKAAGFRGVRFGPIDPDWWDTSLMVGCLAWRGGATSLSHVKEARRAQERLGQGPLCLSGSWGPGAQSP